ncbi:MAG: VIT domain-containing protein [Candidatus Obscuribacterales bacterium]
MKTVESPTPDLAPDKGLADESSTAESACAEPIINGFDSGNRSIFKEPSLYLSIAVVFIAAFACLNKTPTVFWLSVGLMSAVAVIFHIMAERFLFRAKKEHQVFSAPLDGVFVVTLGAILPGLSLLAYGIYSLSKSASESATQQANLIEELAKMALLLVVPFFNFVVWSAVRKRYLVRPRLVGLMNGFAFGLSAAWSAIWVSSVLLAHNNLSCKFGWMLLLCTAPFLLFAAFCLSLDLWHKTEANIRRITTTFSILGILLSFLFAFTPMVRAFYIQSLVSGARQASTDDQSQTLTALRTAATDEDLRPSKYPLGGFALAEMLIPNRGFETGAEADRDLYFKVTGKSYFAPDGKGKKSVEELQAQTNPLIGERIAGLSLAKSQMNGSIDAATLSSSIDWTLAFHNSSDVAQEARCEIAIPRQAVVSRVTLWVNGVPREGAFAPTDKVRAAYQGVVNQQRDPLLVTMSAPDRILVQCFPVAASGGELKIRIGFKLPLQTVDGKMCSMKLPQMLASNFVQLKRHRLNLSSSDLPLASLPGIVVKKNADGYDLSGIVRSDDMGASDCKLVVQKTIPFSEVASLDWYSSKPRYIVERLQQVATLAPKRLLVLIDSSASLKKSAFQIRQALDEIPARLNPTITFAGKQAQVLVNSDAFEGGQDNWPALRDALETAAEQPNSAVLWIHGPQPIVPKLVDSSVLDLVHRVNLYDVQIQPGANAIVPALRMEDTSALIAYETVGNGTTARGLKSLLPIWEGTKQASKSSLAVQRTISAERPTCPIVSDKLVSAQLTSLWAKDEVNKLLAGGHQHEAQVLAAHYRLVTPVTGAVVLETGDDYKANHINPGAYKDAPDRSARLVAALVASPAGGLIGAPVDPRYGQSNEVGQLADYGYDAARDVSRLLTFISLLISIAVAILFVRGRKAKSRIVYAKAVGIVFAAPIVVHIIGTFMINNCGCLGGGL